jgi:hypothetical protein
MVGNLARNFPISASRISAVGTSPRPDFMMAYICSSESEEHHMSLLRQVIGIFAKKQEQFQFRRA